MKRRPLAIFAPLVLSAFVILGGYSISSAAEFKIDPEHSFVEFRIQHLGFSWMHGRFNAISGDFNYDTTSEEANRINVSIETSSVDTNHAERDKHLRSEDFLDVKKFPTATFRSTRFTGDEKGGVMEGVFTLHGVSKGIAIDVHKIGEGEDPWGNYRAGFAGTVKLNRRDFGIFYDLGPTGDTMEFQLTVEGIRK